MTERKIKTILFAALALAAGLALRLWFITHAARISGDTLLYGNIARNWMQQGIYSFTPSPGVPVPTLIRLPGYPLFLMVCFRLFGVEHYTAVLYVQCLIDLLTCLLIAALAGRLFGRRAAMAALALSALCPFMAAYTAAPLTEVLTLFCIALTFYSVHRWQSTAQPITDSEESRKVLPQKGRSLFNPWLWITALALAYSILLRPEQGLLTAAVVPAMLWMAWKQPPRPLSQAILPVALAAICVILPLAPWTVRNWRTFHVVQVLAPRYATDPGELVSHGFDRWYRTWAIDFASTEEVYWNYNSAPIWIGDLPPRAFDSSEQHSRTQALLDEYNSTYNATPQLEARFDALAAERIHNNPIRYYLALPIARLFNMAFRPRVEMLEVPLEWWKKVQDHPQLTALAIEMAVLNFAYFLLGGLGLWRWRRHGWAPHSAIAWAMVAFVALRCALLLTLDNSEPRYTLEFFPLLILWASYLFHSIPALETASDSEK